MPVDTPASRLLDWYDRYRRLLPWRSLPGEVPDPYAVWLSEIMLQQTTVAAVMPRYERFLARWPTVEALAAAPEEAVMQEWAGLGYYARARNMIACARQVAGPLRGRFPDTEDGLRALPGVGGYTAAAVAAIAFGRRAVVIDGNVARVVARLTALSEPPASVPAKLRELVDALTPAARAGDFAQAMMDLGSAICTPRRPSCLTCPLRSDCRAAASGAPERWPVRKAKAVRPERQGTAWWVVEDDRVLTVVRPAKGLLGGMRALPSEGWGGDDEVQIAGGAVLGQVVHVFTHFRLTLDVRGGDLRDCALPEGAQWWPLDRLAEAGLPTVFAKAAALARGLGDARGEPS